MALALVMISGSGRVRNSRIAGVVVTASPPRLSTRSDGIAENAEAGALGAAELAARRAADEIVFAHAEKGEVVLAQPFEEGDRFADILRGDRRRRRAIGFDRLVEPLEHRPPVGDRAAHVGEHRVEPLAKARLVLGQCQAVDMDLDQALADLARPRRSGAAIGDEPARGIPLDGDDRVGNEPDRGAEILELAEDRIEQERHVVVDDLDHRHRDRGARSRATPDRRRGRPHGPANAAASAA